MAEYISPRTGKVVPGVTLCSHAELEHYEALKNLAYRQELWQMWHEVEHEPSNAVLYGEREVQASESLIPTRLAINQQDLTPLRVDMADLRNTINRHIDAGKKKQVQQKTDGIEL